jgi:uridine kinase
MSLYHPLLFTKLINFKLALNTNTIRVMIIKVAQIKAEMEASRQIIEESHQPGEEYPKSIEASRQLVEEYRQSVEASRQRLETILKSSVKMLFALDQSVSIIANALNITEEEVERLLST